MQTVAQAGHKPAEHRTTRHRTPMSGQTRRNRALSFRITDQEHAAITAEARRRGLTRTDYIVQACTGTLEDTTTELARRVHDLETAVQRLETVAY